jgi:hypothetical protein
MITLVGLSEETVERWERKENGGENNIEIQCTGV